MKGLLYKEFYLFRFNLLFIFIIQLIVSALCIPLTIIEADDNTLMIVMLFCHCIPFSCAAMLNGDFFKHDEKSSWFSFVTSSPQALKGQLQSKYYALLLLHLAILFFCFIIDCIVVAMSGNMAVSALLPCVLIFCFRTIINAIEIPFMIRFGSSSGMYVKGVIFGILIFIIAVYGLFGDISFFMENDPLDAILDFFKNGGAIWIISLIPYVAMILYYISYKVSLRLYIKGAEAYEQ